MEIRQYKVYSFKEASEELKEKILANYRYINVDDSFWYEEDEIYSEIAKDYGIKIDIGGANFDLERGSYVAFDTFNHARDSKWLNPIIIEDTAKFCKKAGVKYNDEKIICILHEHYSGGAIRNYIDTDYEEEAKLQECLEELLDNILSQLKLCYHDNISDESVIDTLEVNEYMFNESGKID